MNEEFAVLLFFFGISITGNLALAAAWFRSSRRSRRLEQHILAAREPDDRKADRLEEVVESLAAQVDQLASGQEFLNRVVAERDRPARRLGAPDVEITPH